MDLNSNLSQHTPLIRLEVKYAHLGLMDNFTQPPSLVLCRVTLLFLKRKISNRYNLI